MDNLRSGVFLGERGKKDSQTKGEKDHLIKGWATDYFSCQWWFANQEYMSCH